VGAALLVVLLAGCALRSLVMEGRLPDDGGRDPVELTSPSFTLAPPSYPLVAGWQVSPDGLVVEIDVDDTEPGAGHYTLGADGSVVRVADRTVFMDRGDLTAWRMPTAELERLLRRLEASGVRTEPSVDLDPNPDPGPVVHIGYWTQGVERYLAAPGPEASAVALEMTARPDSGVRRWVPHDIGFLAGPPDHTPRSPLGPQDPFAPWPLATGVRGLAMGRLPNAYEEQKLAVCLHGRAARRAWTLFTGVNTAYLRVDDGRRWELQSFVTTPGYRMLQGPCLGTASN